MHVLDGFTGTGTFMTRLLQLGLIESHDLARKYASELHANEMLLLAYYIAAVNIETTYQDLRRGTLEEGEAEYESFPGLVLTDTFQSYEDGDDDDLGVFPVNNERLNRQRALPITVIVGNPPYSSGQDSANDDNANEKYPALDAAIRDTYAARSTATNKNSLYDSYIRAIKWASLRIKDRGIIAYVTNGGWLDSNTSDGMRSSLAEEFSDIYIYNLRGNGRVGGQAGRAEGRPVFEFAGWAPDGRELKSSRGGSRATIVISVFVKDPSASGPVRIHYGQVDDGLSAGEKLREVARHSSVTQVEPSKEITPNEHADWLNQRRDDFDGFIPLGDKGGEPAVFGLFSGGLKTNRDAWCYNFSDADLARNMRRLIDTYESDRAAGRTSATATRDGDKISWNRGLLTDLDRGRGRTHRLSAHHLATYRPFTHQHVYFDRGLNDMVYRLADLFPTPQHQNVGFYQVGSGSAVPFSVVAVEGLPDLHVTGAGSGGQFFARWRYEPIEPDQGMLAITAHGGEVVDGCRKVDNITDKALAHFQGAYGEAFTKDDVFFYVYGLLHSSNYRATYAADLKKSLPRIPLVADPAPFVDAGRVLSELHLDYESVTPFALVGSAVDPGDVDLYEFYRVEKMKFAKVRDPETNKLVADKSTIIYNSRITLSGIPEEAYRYMLGSRSAIEWIIDRYQVKTDKASGIVNDPNDWSREVEDPRYIIDLLARVVTVSLQTMAIVDGLPPLEVKEQQ